jgi:hypothetical protein
MSENTIYWYTLTLEVIFVQKLFLAVIEKIRERIHAYEYLLSSRKRPKDFSRKGAIGFVHTMLSTMNLNNKSQQMELDTYFDIVGKESVSKQAFSQARQKINPEAFKELFEIGIHEAAKNHELSRFEGFTPIAIDGSTLALDNTEELKAFFGCSGPANNSCTARASIACDVCNSIIMDASIAPYATGERAMAMSHIENVLKLPVENPLFLFDRGYVSDDILARIESAGAKYIMRVRSRWHAQLVEKTASGGWGTYRHQGNEHAVRIIKLSLPSGGTEVLFTNLARFDPEEFLQIYQMRWPVETKYDCLKNKLMLENFSGKTVIAVLQDFWATMTLSNLAVFVKLETDTRIKEKDQDKELTYQYQTNMNILIGKLKNHLVLMLLMDDADARTALFNKVVAEIARNKVPIRPGRAFPRKPPRQKKKWLYSQSSGKGIMT